MIQEMVEWKIKHSLIKFSNQNFQRKFGGSCLNEDANDLREMIMYSEENEEGIFNEPKYTENSIEKINAIEEIVDVIISDFEGEEEYLKRLIEIDKFCGNNITLEEERIKLYNKKEKIETLLKIAEWR